MRPGTLLRLHALQPLWKKIIKNHDIVLDIGGYDGAVSQRIKRLFPHTKIALADLDREALVAAASPLVMAITASALELPLKNNSIDVVICLDVIEHINDPSHLLKELSRVLKDDGKVILTTPKENGVSFPFMSQKRIDEVNKSWGHEKPGFSDNELRELFGHAGLHIMTSSGYFNFFSRLVYRFAFLSSIPFPGKYFLYKIILRFEPLVKLGAMEHIMIAKKGRSK